MIKMDVFAVEYAEKVYHGLHEENIDQLHELYIELSEEKGIDRAKRMCLKLHSICFDKILKELKNHQNRNNEMKYYLWHFLQLMTSSPKVKEKVQFDEELLPKLLELNNFDWDDMRKESLHNVTINYIAFVSGGANDSFYNHVASTNTFQYLYEVLSNCTLSSNDTRIEALILAINLLIEGTADCKKQLNNLDFAGLLIKKIYERTECPVELMKIANVTYQKLILLTSAQKGFVESFRKGFTQEVEKQDIFQPPMKCFNENCKQSIVASFKRCSRCKLVSYCSRECQVEHWKKGHCKNCVSPLT